MTVFRKMWGNAAHDSLYVDKLNTNRSLGMLIFLVVVDLDEIPYAYLN